MIGGNTALVGLLGWPVAHSLSPAMHNAAFAALGMDWAYLPLPVQPEALPTALRGLAALGFQGANVTIPHKQSVMALVDVATDAAYFAGAANTLVCRDGEIIAHNTDVSGFLDALAEADCRPRRAVVLGAGGAARAVCVALFRLGAEVVVANRSAERAQALAASLRSPGTAITACPMDQTALRGALSDADILINATSAGMWPDVGATPLPQAVTLPAGITVFDLVYNPLETALLQRARLAGARCLDGLAMLVHQGAASFELWTGRQPSVDVMRSAAIAALQHLPPTPAPGSGAPEDPCSDT